MARAAEDMIAASSQPSVADAWSDQPTESDGCDYCGLPVRVSRSENVTADAHEGGLYCCYGCRFAHAVVQERGAEGAIRWTVIRLGVAIFFTMNLMAFTMTMWSLDVYDVEPDPFQQSLYQVFRWLSMMLALPVLLLLGVPLLQNAATAWQRRILSTDLLIGAAVGAAYVVSAFSVLRGDGAIYFEVGAMVLVMVTLGRWIEAAGRRRATETLDQLLTLLPDRVTRLRTVDADTVEESVDPAVVSVGDELRIRGGERIATDAVVLRGQTAVDEQTFTGESRPITRGRGDRVLAGTVNLDGDVVVRVTAPFRGGSFGRLLEALRQARNARGHYQQLADRVAGWFFPVVSALAAAVLLWHWSAGPASAIQTAMSVLLIACPCALGLATPLAVWSALSVAVRHQILFRSGEAIERLAGTRAVCFDKTGTLTTGTPHVSQVVTADPKYQAVPWQEIHDLANASAHPFSLALVSWLRRNTDVTSDRISGLRSESIRTVPGAGMEATCDGGHLLRLGSAAFADQPARPALVLSPARAEVAGDVVAVSDAGDSRLSQVAAEPAEQAGWLEQLQDEADRTQASLVVVSSDGAPVAAFLLEESLRPESLTALQAIAADGGSIHVLSGDRREKTSFIRRQLPVPGLQVECGLHPDQKVERIKQIRREHGTTVMVGDGINDAPALAVSDVGMALGCGADISRDSAQVCLLSDDLSQVPWAIHLAGRTRSVIRQNLFWAFGYNSAGMAAAACGWLNPVIAAGLMIASSLVVISNSLRLLSDGDAVAEPVTEVGG